MYVRTMTFSPIQKKNAPPPFCQFLVRLCIVSQNVADVYSKFLFQLNFSRTYCLNPVYYYSSLCASWCHFGKWLKICNEDSYFLNRGWAIKSWLRCKLSKAWHIYHICFFQLTFFYLQFSALPKQNGIFTTTKNHTTAFFLHTAIHLKVVNMIFTLYYCPFWTDSPTLKLHSLKPTKQRLTFF